LKIAQSHTTAYERAPGAVCGGASSATAIIKNKPANNGGTVYPRMRSKTMSSEVGSILPRVTHFTILGTISA